MSKKDKGHKKRDCDDDKCHTKCDKTVDVDVDLKPRVRCTEKAHRNAKFDVELDIKAKPTCRISKKHVKDTGDCHHKCVFEVDVDVDFDCKPKVHECHGPSAKFDLDVCVDSKTHCRVEKKKHC